MKYIVFGRSSRIGSRESGRAGAGRNPSRCRWSLGESQINPPGYSVSRAVEFIHRRAGGDRGQGRPFGGARAPSRRPGEPRVASTRPPQSTRSRRDAFTSSATRPVRRPVRSASRPSSTLLASFSSEFRPVEDFKCGVLVSSNGSRVAASRRPGEMMWP